MQTFCRIATILALCVPLMAQAPITDPTVLTTQQIVQQISGLKELLFTKLDAVNARLDAADKAVILLHADVTRVPTDVDKQVGNLKELTFQKVSALETEVATQFRERDERVNQIAVLNNVALQAALSAAKEAVAKQESNTTKQIDQLYLNSSTVTKAQEVQINDLKTQLAAITARGGGQSDLIGWVIGGVGMLVGVITVIILITRQQPREWERNRYPQPQYPPQQYAQQSQSPQVSVVPVVPVPVKP